MLTTACDCHHHSDFGEISLVDKLTANSCSSIYLLGNANSYGLRGEKLFWVKTVWCWPEAVIAVGR
jgi:hypothetical protein